VVPGDGVPHLSPVTVGEYFKVFRDSIGDFMLTHGDGMVGGPGTTCEIDESMFGVLSCINVLYLYSREKEIQPGPHIWPPPGLGHRWRSQGDR